MVFASFLFEKGLEVAPPGLESWLEKFRVQLFNHHLMLFPKSLLVFTANLVDLRGWCLQHQQGAFSQFRFINCKMRLFIISVLIRLPHRNFLDKKITLCNEAFSKILVLAEYLAASYYFVWTMSSQRESLGTEDSTP